MPPTRDDVYLKNHRIPCGPLIAIILTLSFAPVRIGMPFQAETVARERVRTEIPYREGTVVMLSDTQERITKTRYRAAGHVEITYRDIVLTADEAQYDEQTQEGFAQGQTRFSQKQQWLTCSRAEFNFSTQTGVFYDAQGFTDREFFVRGRTVVKTGPDTYRVDAGFITTCMEPRPKWSFTSSVINLQVDRTARLRGVTFRLKGIPLFYAPYVILPMEGKKRSSGFLPFHTGTSSSKGRVFSEGYYQTLGNSADATIYADYFTARGLAWGVIFRARPNPKTHLSVQAYGIHDKLEQSGANLVVDGITELPNEWRATARVNITTSFRFRQAFADTFRSATIPQENAIVFLTRNHESVSTNLSFERNETVFPDRPVIIRKLPSLEWRFLGTPTGKSPLIFQLRSSIDSLSRSDHAMQTPTVVQRLDLFPRVTLRLPSLAGFSLVPTIGFRETYYGARRSYASPSGVETRSLNRRYVEFGADLRTPTLERDFLHSWIGSFKHAVEPAISYRRIEGIEGFHEIIRFDAEDAVADTNEIEYGIANRFLRIQGANGAVPGESYEFLAFRLSQKYYFDPTFGGAFQPGAANIFYPLNTGTGFALTGTQHKFSPIIMELRVAPKPGTTHDIRADYDTLLERFYDVSFSTVWREDKFFLGGTYIKTPPNAPYMVPSNHIQGQIGYGSPLRGLSASTTLSYNIKTRELINSNSNLNYMWDCCGLAMQFQQYALGLRTESRFSFSFTLKGIGSFGNLKNPESIF